MDYLKKQFKEKKELLMKKLSERLKKLKKLEEDLLDRSNGFTNRKRYCQDLSLL